jgi:hypothetical protein
VTNGHWHLNSRDVAANKHILLAMGGVATGPGERVVFPGVLVILNQGPNTPPSTGGTLREALARARQHTVEGKPYLLDVQVARRGVGWAEKPWVPRIQVAGLRQKKV